MKRDTLLVDKLNTDTQVVFIDPPNSRYHEMVFDFLRSNIKENNFEYENLSVKSNPNLTQWITVKKYKGKFYAYFPSEAFYNTFIQVGDTSLTINDFNDGFVSYPIASKKINRNKTAFSLAEGSGLKHDLSIKVKKNSIYVVRSSLFNVRKLYVVRRKDYAEFPIIVNYCPNSRCPEFNFRN